MLLNMIVKDEGARIERCLKSVLPYVTSAIIVDTGSTDDTVPIILTLCAAHRVPVYVPKIKFENFEQARNAALLGAREYAPNKDDYFLLVDADMELVVEDPTCFDNLTGPSYDIIQKAGTLSYHNRRLVRADQTGVYKGVTHEYLDVPSAGCVAGVHFVDHADGANRKDKFGRDIELLLADLRDHPNNERSWFYLAQSYRDNGQPAQAAQAYFRRVGMGGWDEEVWDAQLNYAHCLESMGDTGGFVREMLRAYDMRPSRAETLYDLAKYFRERGQNNASLLFSEPGMAIPRTEDVLFVNDYVYQTGLKEEFSIAAFYDPAKRGRGFEATNALMLDKTYDGARELAKRNSLFYIQPLSRWAPSFKAHKIDFKPPDGYTPLNPSIVNWNGNLYTTVRTVNYTITADGRYEIRGGDDGSITNDNPIDTRNFIVELNDDLTSWHSGEILWGRPKAQFQPVIGLEDMRLFIEEDILCASACVREQNPEGWCEQMYISLTELKSGVYGVDAYHPMLPEHRAYEKNWMPFVVDDQLRFIYRLGHVIDGNAKTVSKIDVPIHTDLISGGSQLVPFSGGLLAVVHEARHRPDGTRYYQHRFALFTAEGSFTRLSMPFVFHDKQIEFCAGLCWHPDYERLLISYGVRDEEAWIAEMDCNEVMGVFL